MDQPSYNIHTDVRFAPLEQFDVLKFAGEHQPWWNQTLVNVNDCVVRIGVLEGDFHWHSHENEDEFFYVLEGRLKINFEESEVDLHPGQAVVVPRGVRHFPKAIGRTVVLMMEGAGVIPTGD